MIDLEELKNQFLKAFWQERLFLVKSHKGIALVSKVVQTQGYTAIKLFLKKIIPLKNQIYDVRSQFSAQDREADARTVGILYIGVCVRVRAHTHTRTGFGDLIH